MKRFPFGRLRRDALLGVGVEGCVEVSGGGFGIFGGVGSGSELRDGKSPREDVRDRDLMGVLVREICLAGVGEYVVGVCLDWMGPGRRGMLKDGVDKYNVVVERA